MSVRAAETAIINSHTVKRLDASIVRPFNVAGPRQSPAGGFVLPRFIRQAQTNEPLTIFGDGSPQQGGDKLLYTHFVAGILAWCGVDPSPHLDAQVFDAFAV